MVTGHGCGPVRAPEQKVWAYHHALRVVAALLTFREIVERSTYSRIRSIDDPTYGAPNLYVWDGPQPLQVRREVPHIHYELNDTSDRRDVFHDL